MPIGLRNFVNSKNKNSASTTRYIDNFCQHFTILEVIETNKHVLFYVYRDKFAVCTSSRSVFEMNDDGFVVLSNTYFVFKTRFAIILCIKTIPCDGLIFQAFEDDNFMFQLNWKVEKL